MLLKKLQERFAVFQFLQAVALLQLCGFAARTLLR
jgi:hypothetical protein